MVFASLVNLQKGQIWYCVLAYNERGDILSVSNYPLP